MRNHIEKPAVKQVCPIRIPARHSGCQFTDTVFTVPSGKSIKKILQRIEYRHAIWIDITTDVSVPQRNTLHLCIQSNAVQRPFVERIETKTKRKPFPIFHLGDLCVIAKFITAFHEFFGLQGQLLLFAQTDIFAETFTFEIYVANHLPDQHFLFIHIEMKNGTFHDFFLRQSRSKTISGQLYDQWLPFIFPQLEACFAKICINFPKSSFEKHQKGIFRIISRHGTSQRRLLRLHCLPKSRFFGHRCRLREIKLHGIRTIHNIRIIRQSRILLQSRLFGKYIERDLGLITFHGQPIGVSVKQFRLFPCLGQWVIRTGKGGPYLHRFSTRTHKSTAGLRLFTRFLFHQSYLRFIGQGTDSQFNNAIVRFHLLLPVYFSKFCGRNYLRKLVGKHTPIIRKHIL